MQYKYYFFIEHLILNNSLTTYLYNIEVVSIVFLVSTSLYYNIIVIQLNFIILIVNTNIK